MQIREASLNAIEGLPVQVETNSPDRIFGGLGLVLANLQHCQSVRWCGMQSTDKNIYKSMKQKKELP